MNEFWRFTNDAGDEPESAQLDIYDVIGNWEEIGEISAKAFARDLAKLPSSVKRLDIHINSPGGSVFDAQGIYSRLADHRAQKHVYIDGLAASAASIVAMVGHKVFIRANANMMIHLPSAMTMGDKNTHEKARRALQSIEDSMINTYTKKTALSRDEIASMLADETWLNAEQAVEKGFADEVRGVIKAAASFDLSQFKFKNVPAFTATKTTKEEPMSKANIKATAAEETPPAKDEPKKEETPPATEQEPKKDEQPPKTGDAATDAAANAVKQERARVAALLELDRPATHDIVQAAIKDGKQVADVIKDVMSAMDKASTQNARRADASQLDGIPASQDDSDGKKEFGAKIKEKVQARMKRGNVRVTRS